ILDSFGMENCLILYTLLLEEFITYSNLKTSPIDTIQYYRILDKLLFFTNTRPNLLYIVNIGTRFVAKPQ
uniref:Uncharacterized protein n=1 Tax=Physcomitrium patens TaxID=3218 RepID=A0A7I4EQH4_PHYPA